MEEPNSLCASVLRDKYFPEGNLLNAKPKKSSSMIWQCIMAGVEAFKRGYVWQIGDGSQANIWDDNWVPLNPNLRARTPRGGIMLTKVSDLINRVASS